MIGIKNNDEAKMARTKETTCNIKLKGGAR
jgi:hypothetical protein